MKFLKLFIALFVSFFVFSYIICSSVVLDVIDNGTTTHYQYSLNTPIIKHQDSDFSDSNQKLSIKKLTVVTISNNRISMPLSTTSRVSDLNLTHNNDKLFPIVLIKADANTSFIHHNNFSICLMFSFFIAMIITIIWAFYYFPLEQIKIKDRAFSLIDKYYWVYLPIVFLIGKVIYFLVLYKAHLFLDTSNPYSLMCQWDCNYYKSIIYSGYQLHANPIDGGPVSGQANWAFFPLLPIISKGLIYLFHSELSVIVFNQLLLLVSLFLIYDYAKRKISLDIAVVSSLFLAISSENIYFMSIYTESLFLFLSLVILFYLERRMYFLACITCGVLSAVRFPGFLAVILIIYYLWSDGKIKINNFINLKLPIYFLISILGLLSYMIYLHYHVGDSLAFYHIQKAWGRINDSWWNYSNILRNGTIVDRIILVISIIGLTYLYKKKLFNEFVFLFLAVSLAIASKSLQSFSRQILANYAFYILIAASINRRLLVLVFALIVFLMLNLSFTFLWFTSSSFVW